MASASIELERTPGMEALLRRWFITDELDRRGLPLPIVALLEQTIRPDAGRTEPLWTRHGAEGARLEVTIVALPEASYRTVWAILFREQKPVLAPWQRRLTIREREVVSRVALGWDNQLIADDLCCSRGTVIKHLQHIFDKLGVSNRTSLCHLAATQR
jgi:DNA-binding CsgD family transcriptional regulator